MKKRSNILSTLLVVSSLFTLVSCGNDNGSSNSSSSSSSNQEQEQDDQGIYRAVLRPLNTSLSSEASGTAEVRVEADDVVARSNMINTPSGVKHYQYIMTGTACPGEGSDANNDGVVDINETFSSSGAILLPLDSNMAGQLEGMDFGPIANSRGSYHYKRSTSFTRLLADLQSPDPDMTDKVVKLAAGERLNLSGRALVIFGVSPSTNLPDSVSSLADTPAYQLVPIACGPLVRVKNESDSEAPEEIVIPTEETDTPVPESTTVETLPAPEITL